MERTCGVGAFARLGLILNSVTGTHTLKKKKNDKNSLWIPLNDSTCPVSAYFVLVLENTPS